MICLLLFLISSQCQFNPGTYNNCPYYNVADCPATAKTNEFMCKITEGPDGTCSKDCLDPVNYETTGLNIKCIVKKCENLSPINCSLNPVCVVTEGTSECADGCLNPAIYSRTETSNQCTEIPCASRTPPTNTKVSIKVTRVVFSSQYKRNNHVEIKIGGSLKRTDNHVGDQDLIDYNYVNEVFLVWDNVGVEDLTNVRVDVYSDNGKNFIGRNTSVDISSYAQQNAGTTAAITVLTGGITMGTTQSQTVYMTVEVCTTCSPTPDWASCLEEPAPLPEEPPPAPDDPDDPPPLPEEPPPAPDDPDDPPPLPEEPPPAPDEPDDPPPQPEEPPPAPDEPDDPPPQPEEPPPAPDVPDDPPPQPEEPPPAPDDPDDPWPRPPLPEELPESGPDLPPLLPDIPPPEETTDTGVVPCALRTSTQADFEPCGQGDCYWDYQSDPLNNLLCRSKCRAGYAVDNKTKRCELTKCVNPNHLKRRIDGSCVEAPCEERLSNSSRTNPCGSGECYWDQFADPYNSKRCVSTVCTIPAYVPVDKKCTLVPCGEGYLRNIYTLECEIPPEIVVIIPTLPPIVKPRGDEDIPVEEADPPPVSYMDQNGNDLEEESGVSTGAIAGGVVGGVAVVAMSIAVTVVVANHLAGSSAASGGSVADSSASSAADSSSSASSAADSSSSASSSSSSAASANSSSGPDVFDISEDGFGPDLDLSSNVQTVTIDAGAAEAAVPSEVNISVDY